MRKIVVVPVLLAWVAFAGWTQTREAKSETLLRWHFAGAKQLSANKDLKTLSQVLGLPETQEFRAAAARNLAQKAAVRFNKDASTNVNPEIIQLIQPLLPDLFQNESSFHLAARDGQDSDWSLALKLDDARSQSWSKAIGQLATSAGMNNDRGALGDAKNWSASKENYRLSFSREKEWTIIEGGYGKADANAAKQFRSSLNSRRGRQLLEADINSPLLAKIWSANDLAHAPKLSLRVEPRNDGFRSELLLDYPEDTGIKPEKWNIPAGLIYEPLIGFTAIQGVAKKLTGNKTFQAFDAQQTPNQLFMWTQSLTPFSFWIAGEVKNPVKVVENTPRALNHLLPIGSFHTSTNRPVAFWENGPPIVKPFIEAARGAHSSFAAAGLFPATPPDTNTIPSELLAQLNKKNLIYYDWEITSARLNGWVPLRQLYYFTTGKLVPVNAAPSSKWLEALENRLGNSITEGTLENSKRIKFIRQSQLGFTGLELVLLAHWLDGEDLISVADRPSRKQPAPATPRVAPSLPTP